MSEGHGDIRSIRNMMVFFTVLVVIGIVVSVGTTIYGLYKAGFFEMDDEETPAPPAPKTTSAAAPKPSTLKAKK